MANKYGKSEYSYSTKSAPLGIKILTVLIAIGSIIGMVYTVTLIALSPLLTLGSFFWFGFHLVIAINLWRLELWAWKAVIVLQSLSVIATIIQGMVIPFFISLFILLYVFEVRDEFSESTD